MQKETDNNATRHLIETFDSKVTFLRSQNKGYCKSKIKLDMNQRFVIIFFQIIFARYFL